MALVKLATVFPDDVAATVTPASYPMLILALKLDADVHIVDSAPLPAPPTLTRTLKSTLLPPLETTSVMQVDPVTGALLLTMLLKASEGPAKLNALLNVAIPSLLDEVAATETEVSYPMLNLALKLDEDVHIVDSVELPLPAPPTLARALKSTLPTLETSTVMLVDPVVGPFVLTVLLKASEGPAKLMALVKLATVFPDVAATVTPVSCPMLTLALVAEEEVQWVDSAPLPPTLTRALASEVPKPEQRTVIEVDPVLGPFVVKTDEVGLRESKERALLKVPPKVFPEVATMLAEVSKPAGTLALVAEEDVQRVA